MTAGARHRAVRSAAVGGAVALLMAGVSISAAGMADDLQPSDIGVVLGSKVGLTGQPSARLAARLDRGASLYAAGVFRHVLVSGGLGVEGFDEAAVMRDYLLGKGVPASAIIVDSAGATTEATARHGASLMAARGFRRATVVTQYFHAAHPPRAARPWRHQRRLGPRKLFRAARPVFDCARSHRPPRLLAEKPATIRKYLCLNCARPANTATHRYPPTL